MGNICYCDTPVGKIGVASDGDSITNLFFADEEKKIVAEGVRRIDGETWQTRIDMSGDFIERETPLIRDAMNQLREYFDGKRRNFDLHLAPSGTDFQRSVWDALLRIPYGETRSYAYIAREIGRNKAFRAVGMANNRNPIAIIIPCHRVVGSDGSLTGFGAGIEAKSWLLELESR